MKKGEKKEKPTPRRCVCGLEAIVVKTKHGKMLSCPNPMRCAGNLRTTWEKSEDAAVVKWNNLVSDFNTKKRNTGR